MLLQDLSTLTYLSTGRFNLLTVQVGRLICASVMGKYGRMTMGWPNASRTGVGSIQNMHKVSTSYKSSFSESKQCGHLFIN